MSIIYLKGCIAIIVLLLIIGAAAAAYGVFVDKRQIELSGIEWGITKEFS